MSDLYKMKPEALLEHMSDLVATQTDDIYQLEKGEKILNAKLLLRVAERLGVLGDGLKQLISSLDNSATWNKRHSWVMGGLTFVLVIATVALVLVGWRQANLLEEYTSETRRLVNIAGEQQRINSEVLVEMKEARYAQYRPLVDVWFEPAQGSSNYVITARNYGGGSAAGLRFFYEVNGQRQEHVYEVLGPGQEVTNRTTLTSGNVSAAGAIAINLSYRDVFDNLTERRVERQLSDRDVPRSRYSEWGTMFEREHQRLVDEWRMVNSLVEAIKASGKQEQ